MHGPSDGHTEDAISEMNVIPFVDICLVLLIIVIMSSTKPQTDDVEIDVPKAQVQETADINLAVMVAVDKEGKFYFEDNLASPIDAKSIYTILREVKRNSGDWPLLMIKADKSAPYRHLANLFQCAQTLGVERISLAVEKEEEER
jgi:biopolymer transport protein ExbD